MRTRHWKQLVRVSGSTALVDNETLKMLTFGQLLELNIHGKYQFIINIFNNKIKFLFIVLNKAHFDEVKQIVNKAIKDLSIEQTLKTYEEIWLSKVFTLTPYSINKFDTEAITTHDDDVID